MIAALYVQKGGCYFGLPGVDPWDARRDARRYAGPWPVVAHPPCARWCNFAPMAEQRHAAKPQIVIPGLEYGTRVGEDSGCFAAALASVRTWGGVLEHPKGTRAWATHGLEAPPREGWARSGSGWVCEVSQGRYGHRADKLTWLYYEGDAAPPRSGLGRPRSPRWSVVSVLARVRGLLVRRPPSACPRVPVSARGRVDVEPLRGGTDGHGFAARIG